MSIHFMFHDQPPLLLAGVGQTEEMKSETGAFTASFLLSQSTYLDACESERDEGDGTYT